MSQDKTINILIVSDIHLSFSNIKKLGEKINNKKIDLIICGGDICNFDPVNSDDLVKVKECEKEMIDIFKVLHEIVPTVDILYVPGNHDAKTTLLFEGCENQDEEKKSIDYSKPPKLTDRSYNIHKSNFRLDDDLVLVGLGGSLPSYCDNKPHWAGYPYDCINEDGEKQVLSDLNQSLKHKDTINSKDKIILLTHMGPYNCYTTIDQIDLSISPIYSGSKSIENIIKENQQQIFLNIHGHTHHSTGLAKVGKTYVCNPGSLRSGHYVILKVEKFCNQLWRLKSTKFYKL
ncbi:hypothetical protein RB653_000057 [Dictyostelium firmibasis]|uniref:Calcineurin-like phosphoesterase domain-containing protein n=1 Tax=Dictyostelium firmibasis TaxID=79012 RepID=A0AAN7TUJ3_9MYCE